MSYLRRGVSMSCCCSSSALAPLQSMRQPLCCVNIGRSVTQHAVTRPGPTMRLMITIAAVMYASRFSSKLSSGSGPLPRPTQNLGSEEAPATGIRRVGGVLGVGPCVGGGVVAAE